MVDVQCSFVSISVKLAAFQAGGAETLTPLAQTYLCKNLEDKTLLGLKQ